MTVLREAARKLGTPRLSDLTVFTTLEPCAMCVGAMILARVDRVVFGAASPKAGALGGLVDLNALPHNHRLEVRAGVLEAECAERLTRFFQGLRSPEG
jgi:tRNA(Arg) A34 adenosine deaminase TadA